MKHTFIYICASFLLLALVACNHKELCLHYPHRAKIRINVDWSEFPEEKPSGMTVMTYSETDAIPPQTILSNTLDHVYVNLEEGNYHTLVFNQSVSEFGSFIFRDMDKWELAEVVAANVSSRWYEGRADEERVVTEPEWLGIDSDGTVEVTPEMAEISSEHMGSAPKEEVEYVIATHVPRNIIYTMHVEVHIPGGVYNLRSARAALGGLSEGVKFSTLRRDNDIVTQLLEEWTLTVDKENPVQGTLTTSFQCFGLPHSHQGIPEENHFLLSMLLVDNKTQVDVPFEVGHLFERDEDSTTLTLYLELTLPEVLPDVKPEGGSGSGFDATVEDWGEEIEHEIQM